MAKTDYAAPGMTIAEVEAEIATALGLDKADATDLARIDKAITAAGQAASTWEGRDWWWLYGTNSFSTVASTGSYALRTVNEAAMAQLWQVNAVWLGDDYQLRASTQDAYTEYITLHSSDTGRPAYYALSNDLTMYLWPLPDAVYTVTVNYRLRHSKITSAGSNDAALIVPAEFHWPVYVDGGIWLLKHQNVDPKPLSQCESFVEAMRMMAANQPRIAAVDGDGDRPLCPADTKVFWTGTLS